MLRSAVRSIVRALWYLLFVMPGLMWREWLRNVFGPSREEIASADVALKRRIAESEAAPTDRVLARALISSAEAPVGMVEVRRSWKAIASSGSEVAAVEQHFAERSGRLRRRRSTRSIQLTVRRFADEQMAGVVVASAVAQRMPDGTRMRERSANEGDSIRIFEWNRREDGQTTETLLMLHTRQGTALASLSAAHRAPTATWEQEMVELMRNVRSRLR